MTKDYRFDSACEGLALYFLADHPNAPPKAKAELAQAIQDAVEAWLETYAALLTGEGEQQDPHKCRNCGADIIQWAESSLCYDCKREIERHAGEEKQP